MKKIIYLLLAGALMLPGIAGAAYFAANDYVSPSGPISADIYAAGNSVSVRQPVGDDAFLAGNMVEVSESVGHSVFAAGQNVSIRGNVGDDVYTAGNIVDIEAPRVKELFAAGNTIKIGSNTQITGDAFLAGQTLDISGKINGNVRTAAASIVLQRGASITGDLITYGQKKPTIKISDGASISGQQKHVVWQGPTRSKEKVQQMFILGWVRNVITWFVVALVLLYLMPAMTRSVLNTANSRPWPSIGIGALWLLLFIPVIILLFATIIGAPLALVLIAATVIFIIISIGYVSLIAGVWLMRKLFKQESDIITWQHALLGAVATAIIGIIPIIGWLAIFLLFLLSLGTVARVVTRTLRHKEVA